MGDKVCVQLIWISSVAGLPVGLGQGRYAVIVAFNCGPKGYHFNGLETTPKYNTLGPLESKLLLRGVLCVYPRSLAVAAVLYVTDVFKCLVSLLMNI